MAQIRISCMCTLWPWPWRCDLWWRSWHTLGSWTTIVWNIQIQHGSEELWPWHGFRYVCTMTLTFQVWPWVKVRTHPWIMNNNCVKYLGLTWQWGVMAQTQILGMRALWPWRYDLESWTTTVWNIQIGQRGKELWPGHDANRQMD